jgi:hypothetical protein
MDYAFTEYIVDHLNGVIGEEYAEPQGRIVLKHANLKPVAAVAPTCTADGTKEYYSCGCTALFSDAEGKVQIAPDDIIVPADPVNGHAWTVKEVVTKATTKKAGVKVCECELCSQTKEAAIEKNDDCQGFDQDCKCQEG